MLTHLRAILEKMHDATQNADQEAAHGDADGMLIATIEVLRDSMELPEEERAVIAAILEAYSDVDKWYA